MKTFFSIYHISSKKLIDEIIFELTPKDALDNWVIDINNSIPSNELANYLIFYHTGTDDADDQISGKIQFNSCSKSYEFTKSPMYFAEKMGKIIYYDFKDIIWVDDENRYVLIPEDFDFTLKEKEIQVLNPEFESFMAFKKEFNSLLIHEGEENVLRTYRLKIKKFYDKCDTCLEHSAQNITSMIEGKFICQKCNKN